MAENINVVARVRPFSEWIGAGQRDSCCVKMDPRTSTIFVKTAQHQQEKKFNVNKAFDQETKQETIYAEVGKRIVNGFVEGINGTIFAYGQTGSGKTFTMLGPEAQGRAFFDHKNRGVIPRAIEDIFDSLDAEVENNPKTFAYSMRCSFLELYNERLYDLLQDNNDAIKIQAGVDRQISVIGAAEIEVSSSSQCMDLLWRGWNQRKVAETSMNRESSRSHAVFTLYLETQFIEDFVINRRSSRLNLVDLAGSERQGHTNNSGDRLKEASNINKSLTFLARVIRTLAASTSKKPEHVPYRDSQLTYLLKDSLGGNARTAVIVNIHPNHRFFGETISTLHFAENCKKIQNTAKVNEAVSCDDVAAWKAEIERLRAENRLLRDQLSSAPSAIQKVIYPKIESAEIQHQVLTADQRKERRQTKFISKQAYLPPPISADAPEATNNLEQKLADTQELYEIEERMRLEHEVTIDQLSQVVADRDARITQLESRNSVLKAANSDLEARISQLEVELASKQLRCDHEKEYEELRRNYQSSLNVEKMKFQTLAQTLQTQCQILRKEKEVMQEQRDDFLNQLNEGAGHNNHAQKIQHLEKMKNDLKAAKNENAKLKSHMMKTFHYTEKDIATFLRSN